MKAVISTTFEDKYFWFLPITVWCWNKLGVNIICFIPVSSWSLKDCLLWDTLVNNKMKYSVKEFSSPKHKEATYTQCSRLYAAALDLPEDEVLITSDADMCVFGNKFSELNDGNIHSLGGDLLDVHQMKQYPMCYTAMPVKEWRRIMDIGDKTYQQCLDETVGVIECDHFRGNQWSLDQSTLYNQFQKHNVVPLIHNRAKYPERFAKNRLDRDDAYLLDRLNLDILDYHMPRPGFEEKNFEQILTVLKYFYPNDSFDWLKEYTEKYIQLL